MNTDLRRFYVSVGGRVVHGRRAGKGPPLLLVHQSPRTSAELEPLIQALAPQFDVIAPDTPGNGLSESLGAASYALAPFADALAEFLNAIGVQRCIAYGFHTGAAMAAALAVRHPDRVLGVVLNGLPAFTAEEALELQTRYLLPIEPTWDGAHFAWAWARMKEQLVHFPWYEHKMATRMDFDMPPPDYLTDTVIDLCNASASYRIPYGSAFVDSGPALAEMVKCPARILSTARDPLAPHLERYTDLPPNLQVSLLDPGIDPVVAEILAMQSAVGAGVLSEVEVKLPRDRYYSGAPGRQVHVRMRGLASGVSKLLLHDIGEDGKFCLSRDDEDWNTLRLAPDLPGHGASDPWSGQDRDARLLEAVGASGITFDTVEVFGGQLSVWDQLLESDLCGGVEATLRSPEWDRARCSAEAQAFAPADFGGGHILRLWHKVRDSFLYERWWAGTAASRRTDRGAPTPQLVHEGVIAALIARKAAAEFIEARSAALLSR